MRRKITVRYNNPKSEQVYVIYKGEKYSSTKDVVTFFDPNPFTFKTGILEVGLEWLMKSSLWHGTKNGSTTTTIFSFTNFNRKSLKYPTFSISGHAQIIDVVFEHDISKLYEYNGLIKSMIVTKSDTITNIDGLFKYLNAKDENGRFEIFNITQSTSSYTVFYKYLEKPKPKTFKNLIDF